MGSEETRSSTFSCRTSPLFFFRRLRSVPQLTENSLQEAMARVKGLLHYGETCE